MSQLLQPTAFADEMYSRNSQPVALDFPDTMVIGKGYLINADQSKNSVRESLDLFSFTNNAGIFTNRKCHGKCRSARFFTVIDSLTMAALGNIPGADISIGRYVDTSRALE